MLIEVYSSRTNVAAADKLVEQLRAEGHMVRGANVRYFDVAQLDKQVEQVFHDGTQPLVPWAFGKLSIPVAVIPGCDGEGSHGPDSTSEVFLTVVESGFQLTGPQGPIGEPQPNEADAWGQLGAPIAEVQQGAGGFAPLGEVRQEEQASVPAETAQVLAELGLPATPENAALLEPDGKA